jgi:uncharacterized membrane protein YeaQ/YmgE (transglycosylase-associated protein family)
MNTLFAILIWCLFGLVAGALARLLVPGRQPMGILLTMMLGIIGSFVGGFIGWFFVGGEPLQASGLLLSVLGAVLVLWVYVASARRRTA